MTQPTLFDALGDAPIREEGEGAVGAFAPSPRARLSDPQTSKDAAAQVNVSRACQRVLDTLRECERTNAPERVGATCSELMMRQSYDNEPAMPTNVIARRLGDLRDMGLAEVAEDEDGPIVRMANTGRNQSVWVSA